MLQSKINSIKNQYRKINSSQTNFAKAHPPTNLKLARPVIQKPKRKQLYGKIEGMMHKQTIGCLYI